jgi:starch phosphorylase
MNGALTIGTLDGANIEIREKAGEENFFLFGMNALEAEEAKKSYNPNQIIAKDDDILQILELLESGHFNVTEPGIFDLITASLRSPNDQWLTIGDLRDYIDAQLRVNEAYKDQDRWTKMSILNSANSGWFSSDRTIRQYADEIWNIKPLARLSDK